PVVEEGGGHVHGGGRKVARKTSAGQDPASVGGGGGDAGLGGIEKLPCTVEIVCASCRVKYAFCTDCGGGGKFRTGKYRPIELFPNNRRTCILSHARISDSTQAYRIVATNAGPKDMSDTILTEVHKVFTDAIISYVGTSTILEGLTKTNTVGIRWPSFKDVTDRIDEAWNDVLNEFADSDRVSKERNVSRYLGMSFVPNVVRRKKQVSTNVVPSDLTILSKSSSILSLMGISVNSDGTIDNRNNINTDKDDNNSTSTTTPSSNILAPISSPTSSFASFEPSTIPDLSTNMVAGFIYFEWNRNNGTVLCCQEGILMMSQPKFTLNKQIQRCAMALILHERERWVKNLYGDFSSGFPCYFDLDEHLKSVSKVPPPVSHIWIQINKGDSRLAEWATSLGYLPLDVYCERYPGTVDRRLFELRQEDLKVNGVAYVLSVGDLMKEEEEV
ncbi:hypothetical protein HDU76_001598, partial [Blyttiomyces sp. JEL0837]